MKKLFSIITLALTLSCAAARAGMFDPEDALDRAGKLADQGKYMEALDNLLYGLLDASPDQETRIRVARSSVYAAKGDVLAALDEMDSAVRGAPRDSCVLVERALLYYTFGEPGLAQMDADAALRKGCEDSDLSALRARLYLRNGDPVNAIDWFHELLFSQNHAFEARSSLGIAYALLGYPATAAAFFKEALKIDDSNPRVHSELADALTLLGDMDGAITHYRKSLELDPANDIAANNYGYTLVLAGRADEAVPVFNKINSGKNPTPYSLCNMLEINLARENWQGAMVFGGLCLNAFVNDPDMMENERYYFAAARRAMDTIRSDTLTVHPLTQIDLAFQHLEYGERVDALSAFLMALMIDPHNVEATYQAGRLFLEYGEPSRGASYLNLAASLAGPRSPTAEKARLLISRESLSLIGNSSAEPLRDEISSAPPALPAQGDSSP